MHLKSKRITQALIIIALLALSFSGFAQGPSLLNYQGVARNAVGNPLPNQTMTLRVSIRNNSSAGPVLYTETRTIKTNLGGLFSVQIGSAGTVSSSGTIAGINWIVGTKYLQVEIDPKVDNNFLDLGTVLLVNVPYAFSADIAAKVITNANLTGVVTSVGNQTSIANGAITSDMIGTLNKSKVGLDLVNNTSDAAKPISISTQAALDLKASVVEVNSLSTSIGTKLNIADSLTKYVTPSQLASYNFSGGGGGSNSSTFLTFSAPLSLSGNSVSISKSSGSANGYLSSSDWTSFNNKIDASQKAANNGVATLGNDGKIPSNQIPAVSFQSANVVTSQAAMLGLSSAVIGSIAIRTDDNKNYVLSALPSSTLSNWIQLVTPTSVTSVNGFAGPSVVLTTNDVLEGSTYKYYTDARVRGTLSATAPLNFNSNTGTFSLTSASASREGYLSSTDWNTFNNKQNALTNAQVGVLSNTSGTNTGDETSATIKNKLGITTLSGSNTGDQIISLTGDLTGTGTGTFSTTLTNSGVNAGAYGSASAIPTFTVDAKGRITAARVVNLPSSGVNTIGSIGVTSNINGANISGTTLTLAPADGNNGGIVTTGVQTFAGAKTFSNTVTFNTDITLNSITVGRGGGNNGSNTSLGINGLYRNTTGVNNTAIGSYASELNTIGSYNTVIGTRALSYNTSGSFNTAIGTSSLGYNTGEQNTAVGQGSLERNTSGNYNTGIGRIALFANITGINNTALGLSALSVNETGSNNTAIGTEANVASVGLNNTTAIGYQASVSADNTIQLGNTNVTNVNTSGTITSGAVTYPNIDGTSGQVLSTTGSGTLTWTTVSGGGMSSVGPISGTSTANGASITSGVLNLAPANATNGGIVTTGNQTFAGGKFFNDNIQVNSIRIGAPGSGSANTMVGAFSFLYGSPGSNNTAVGTMSLASITNSNNGGSPGGNDNTAVGTNAIRQGGAANGNRNTAVGSSALSNGSATSNNTSLGYSTLSNVTGDANTAVGSSALLTNTSGTYNTAIGYGADVSSGTLSNSTAIGNGALVTASNMIQLGNISVTNVKTSGTITAGAVTYPSTHGSNNQVLTTSGSGTLTWTTVSGGSGVPYTGAIGAVNLGAYDLKVQGLTIGLGNGSESSNTVFGRTALFSNANTAPSAGTLGIDNTAMGKEALYFNTTGSKNTSVGSDALYSNSSGEENTAFGMQSLFDNTQGSFNTGIGMHALEKNKTGNYNTALGVWAGVNTPYVNLTNTTAIGYSAKVTESNTIQLGNSNITKVNTSGAITAGAGTSSIAGSLVVGGTAATGSSAALEVKSTTQGLLPPRMTGNQRDAITNPATGLIIYCTNCGLNGGEPEYYNGRIWVNLVGGTTQSAVPNYSPGADAYGGKVAYLYTSLDPGFDPNVDHGLIAAVVDQGSATNGISQGNTPTDYGISQTNNYRGGGYSDWRLPTLSELNKLYINRVAIGGFDLSQSYWSSDLSNGWQTLINFNNGNQGTTNNIYNLNKVRAVRAF